MITAVTNNQMKELERYSDAHGVSYAELMENAGRNAAKAIKSVCTRNKLSKIVFLAGNGNNGGDCFVAARELKALGFEPAVLLAAGKPKTELSKAAYEKAVEAGVIFIEKLPANIDVLADGIFGTGFHGELPLKAASLLAADAKYKIAIDIPSGGNGTDGTADEHSFRADMTLTFAYPKTGMFQYPLRAFCGQIMQINIGIPEDAMQINGFRWNVPTKEAMADLVPPRAADSNKGSYGKLLCITGSETMPGAAAMSTLAALSCGAGLVTVATARQNIPILASRLYSPVYLALDTDDEGFITFDTANFVKLSKALSGATAVLFGCGTGVTDDIRSIARWLIRTAKCPVIIDADGLNCIAEDTRILNEAAAPLVITPHPGEMSRLCEKSVSDIQQSRITTAEDFLLKYPKVTLVLKGAGTVTASVGESYINLNGNPGMAKGGSGDVLAGMTASLAAQGLPAPRAAALAVYLHGAAGDKAAEKYSQQAMQPAHIAGCVGEVFKELEDR